MFAQKLSEAWSVPVTVENMPGGGGSVGGERVAKSPPDGYTLYWGANGAMTINPSLQPNPTFDPQRDLAPIARLLVSPSILAVNNDVPAKTVAELIALAKAQPGKLSFASPGAGTPQHIAGEVFKAPARPRHRACALSRREFHRRDRRARHHDVPERRRDPADRARGQAARARHDGAQALAQHAGASDHGRSRACRISRWRHGSGCSRRPERRRRSSRSCHRRRSGSCRSRDLREKFGKIGLDVVSDAPDAFAAIIRNDIAKWAKVIKDAGIKAGE